MQLQQAGQADEQSEILRNSLRINYLGISRDCHTFKKTTTITTAVTNVVRNFQKDYLNFRTDCEIWLKIPPYILY